MAPWFDAGRGHRNMLLSIYTLQVSDYKELTPNMGPRCVSTGWMVNLQSSRRIATFHSVFHRLRALIQPPASRVSPVLHSFKLPREHRINPNVKLGTAAAQIVCGPRSSRTGK